MEIVYFLPSALINAKSTMLIHDFRHYIHFPCKAALLLSLATGILQGPAQAAVLDSETVEFDPVNSGPTCSFTPGGSGKLGISTTNDFIGTEPTNGIAGGNRASYSANTNIQNAAVTVDSPSVFANTGQYIPAAITLYASRNSINEDTSSSNGTITLNNFGNGDSTNIGLIFTPSDGDNTFGEGTYSARVILTCTG